MAVLYNEAYKKRAFYYNAANKTCTRELVLQFSTEKKRISHTCERYFYIHYYAVLKILLFCLIILEKTLS